MKQQPYHSLYHYLQRNHYFPSKIFCDRTGLSWEQLVDITNSKKLRKPIRIVAERAMLKFLVEMGDNSEEVRELVAKL